jgi:hypothetical protein
MADDDLHHGHGVVVEDSGDIFRRTLSYFRFLFGENLPDLMANNPRCVVVGDGAVGKVILLRLDV